MPPAPARRPKAKADAGLLYALAAQPRTGDAAKMEQVLLDQLEQIAKTPISAEEVVQAQQRIANAYDLYFTDVNAVGMGLSEYVAAGDWRLLFTSRDAIAKVTAADVNRVAAQYLRASNRTWPGSSRPTPRTGWKCRRRRRQAAWSPATPAARRSRPARTSSRARPTSRRAPSASPSARA